MAGSAGTAYGTKKNFYQEDNIIMQRGNSYGILLKAIENI